MFSFVLTPAAGKRLVARAVADHPALGAALRSGTVVLVAGTTNGYVAEELLARIGRAGEFDRNRFFRGVTVAPRRATTATGRLPDAGAFPGDVVLVDGAWRKGATIFDVAESLREGDVILKGANAVDLSRRRAAVLIGDPRGGTVAVAIGVAAGRRVRLILPVGVEKRVPGGLDSLAARLNAPGAEGPRLLPVAGEIVTELDAITMLTGAAAELAAGGGVGGAEGAVWLAVSGSASQEKAARDLLESVCGEPPFNP